MKKLFSLLTATLLAAGLASAAEVKTTHEHTICLDSTLTLTADTLRYKHTWSTGDTTASIRVTPTSLGEHTYTCETYYYDILTSNNLMANGDFENYTDYHQAPTGFTSDYEYLPFSPTASGLYYEYPDKSGAYLLTCNANTTWFEYAPVRPHSGTYFAMFDAAQSGFAWRVSTNENPGMTLVKGGLYLFSYWAADLNPDEKDFRKHPARLQFSINYKDDATGQMTKEYLGQEMVLGKDNKWHYSETFWTAPCNSSYIEIGVEDNNNYYGVGNDFGLDDIYFQLVKDEITVHVARETFLVTVEDCRPCEDLVLRKWDDVLFVDNSKERFVSYQWLADGEEMPGETRQFLHLPDGVGTAEYSCRMQETDGSVLTTCAATFDHTTPSVSSRSDKEKHPVAEKRILDGRLIIRHDQAAYNLLGVRVGTRFTK